MFATIPKNTEYHPQLKPPLARQILHRDVCQKLHFFSSQLALWGNPPHLFPYSPFLHCQNKTLNKNVGQLSNTTQFYHAGYRY